MLGKLGLERGGLAVKEHELQKAITQAREKWEPAINKLKAAIAAKEAALQTWAEGAREDFGDKKSVELLHGKLSFRKGPPKLAVLSRWKWKTVLAELMLSAGRKFLVKKFDIDKEAILSAATGPEGTVTKEELSSWGLKIEQEEFFYAEPKEL